MPELPEVETVRRGLLPVMVGHRIIRPRSAAPTCAGPFPDRMAERLTGARVTGIGAAVEIPARGARHRRGRCSCTWACRGGCWWAGACWGVVPRRGGRPGPHDHVILDMEDGARVTFNDAARFGVDGPLAQRRPGEHRLLARIGPEPLGNAFSADTLAQAFPRPPRRSRPRSSTRGSSRASATSTSPSPRAGGHPSPARRGADRPRRLERSPPAIREVLEEAIEAGGSTLRDHRQADGELGLFPAQLPRLWSRGQPCLGEGCGGTMRRIVQSGARPTTARPVKGSAVEQPARFPSRDAASDSTPAAGTP
jgi:formamidopyrimidine-DNA glycosylase